MCGIAGSWSTKSQTGETRDLIKEIVESQYQRGPDYQAIDTVAGEHANLILGANRLSIIDLSPEANQPMWDNERRYCLVFNGEIYNYVELRKELIALGHSFSTRSDSEVILESFKEWGVRAAERFNGMFAFALFDKGEECLYLFRDRFGVKPLYYFVDDNRLYFASTCGVLARRLRLEPNLDYVARGLRLWVYDYGELSPFVGLKALKPAHYLRVKVTEVGKLETRMDSYYRLDERVEALIDSLVRKPTQDLIGLVADLLEDAVDVRFRADVPVGISLSGGLDSSTIAALSASGEHGDVVGFNLGHPNDTSTEGPLAQKLSERIGIKVRSLRPRAQDIANIYFKILDAQGAPFTSVGSAIGQYQVFQAVKEEGIKVLIGGQGGDEIFMGYRKYLPFRLRRLLQQRRFGEALTFSLGSLPTALVELRRATPMYWRTRRRYTHGSGIDTVLKLPEAGCEYIGYTPDEPLWVRQLHDVTHVSLPTLLRYEDRNSMGNSVESRLPFLDYRLVEVALALPDAVKLRGGFGKWILREVAREKIPEEIRKARYKRGFDVRESDWFEQGLGAAMRDALRIRLPEIKQFLEPGAKVDELFSDAQLKHRTLASAEATTLIWLGNNIA
jgi:asparagine synthase (glutamine-hydrolysing)